MRLLSPITNANDIAKHKNEGKWGSYAQEKGKMMLLSTRTTTNEIAKHNYKGKWAVFVQEHWQIHLLSTTIISAFPGV